VRGIVNVVAIKAPGFGERRKALLQDMAIVTGAEFIAKDLGLKVEACVPEQLGTVRKLRISANSTTMIADAASREEIDLRNRLDSQTYEVEKNVKEWGDKVSAELKTRVDEAVEKARTALRGDDLGAIRAAQEELTRAYSEAGQAFYQQQAASGDAGAPEAGAASAAEGGDEVAEADYEIVDDK
jgi:molecular chaperone DnaK